MAQLVKLQDYASRYETDAYRYPGQFIRLKKENWKKMKHVWAEHHKVKENPWEFSYGEEVEDFMFKEGFPSSEQELKQYFVDGLLPFQLKWASRTLREMSFLDDYFKEDETLKYFLQRFPDTFLFMYSPVFRIKNAPLETDHILIHPQGIYCISILEREEGAQIIPGDDRLWYQENNLVRSKFLSPLISLKRTSRVVRNILDAHGHDFPVTKLVLAPNHSISASTPPYLTEYVGMENYQEWFEKMRSYLSPLKYKQLKTLEVLLKHGQTTSIKRPEWDADEDNFMGG